MCRLCNPFYKHTLLMEESSLPGDIVIFTDPGEEIDDELALYRFDQILAHLQTSSSDPQHGHVVVVGGKLDAKQRIERCKLILKDTKYLRFWTPETFDPGLLDGANVLIIGPLELGKDSERIISPEFTPKLMVLAGSKGSSVNWGSSKDVQDNCQKLMESATSSLVIDSQELSKQKMTPDVLNRFPARFHTHVALLTWRFLLGRARAPAKHVAHLASPSLAALKTRTASNYVAVEAVYKHKYSKQLADLTAQEDALKLAEEYASSLPDFDVYCSRDVNIGRNVVIAEYANLMVALLELGWYTDRVFYSDDAILSDDYLLNNNVPEFQQFCETVFLEIGSPLPCYDLTALYKFLDILNIP